MQIGFTSTSFRQIRDLEKIVRTARASCADCIEWGGDVHVRNESDARKAKELCDAYGVGISSYGSYYRVGSCLKDEWERICRIASLMNCSSVRVWLGNKNSEETENDECERILEDLQTICRIASAYDLLVCPECHDQTFNNDTDAFLKIRKEVGADNLRTYFQSRYKKQAYDLDRILRTAPYLESVHISFSELCREQFPSYDPLYINRLLEALLSVGFDGKLLIEYTYLFCWAGSRRSMIRDIGKIKEMVDKIS